MRLSERFTLYVHEDANSKGALAVTRRAAAEAGKGRVAVVISRSNLLGSATNALGSEARVRVCDR